MCSSRSVVRHMAKMLVTPLKVVNRALWVKRTPTNSTVSPSVVDMTKKRNEDPLIRGIASPRRQHINRCQINTLRFSTKIFDMIFSLRAPLSDVQLTATTTFN